VIAIVAAGFVPTTPSLYKAPPFAVAVFFVNVPPLIVISAPLAAYKPPPLAAVLFVTVLFVSVTLPPNAASIAPPL